MENVIEYSTRHAKPGDSRAMDMIQRETFGSGNTFGSFSKELRRPHTSYILAVRPLTIDDIRRVLRRRPKGIGGWINRAYFRLRGKSEYASASSSEDHISGFVGVWTAVDQAHIVVIAVHPGERRRGIGEMLLIEALKEASSKGARTATLEVRKSNDAARALYKKYGFVDAGIRHKYYLDNGEDAVIMTTPAINTILFTRMLERRINSFQSRRGLLARIGSA